MILYDNTEQMRKMNYEHPEDILQHVILCKYIIVKYKYSLWWFTPDILCTYACCSSPKNFHLFKILNIKEKSRGTQRCYIIIYNIQSYNRWNVDDAWCVRLL